jgi:hypothetical protein
MGLDVNIGAVGMRKQDVFWQASISLAFQATVNDERSHDSITLYPPLMLPTNQSP